MAALAWSGVGNYGASLLHLVSLLGLGWLLPPADFGLVAMALVFLGLTEGLGELGMTSALIQQKRIDRRALDSAFWCNLVLCLVMTAATVVGAEPITGLLGDRAAAPLLRLLSLIFLITALAVVPRALLAREMRFRSISTAQLLGEVGYGAVGLSMAALGFGAWSLAAAVLAQRAAGSIWLWRSVDYRPGLAVDRQALAGLLRFGIPVTATTVVDRGLLRADYFVVGRFIGTEALGYYSLALQLAFIPLQRLVGLIHRVAFPAFSQVQEELQRLRRGLLEGIRHSWALIVPVVMAIAVLGPWLLRAVYGEKWEVSIMPLRILGLSGLCLLPRVVDAALLAVGRASLRLWLSLLRLAVFVALAGTIGLHYGVSGVAASVAGSLAAWAAAYLAIVIWLLRIGPLAIAGALWPALRAALVALTPLALFLFLSPASLSPWLVLIYSGATMGGIYLAIMRPTYRGLLDERRRS